MSETALLPMTSVVEGITLLRHDADVFDRAPRILLDTAPLAVLGGVEGDPEFDLTRVSDVILLGDRRIATLATIGNRLLIFSEDGRGQRSLGRTGGGPGEIMAPGGMVALDGDTLFVPDSGNRRLNWVLPDHGVVRSLPIEEPRALGPFSRAAGPLPDGRVIMHSGGLVQQGVADSVVRPPALVMLLDPARGTLKEIARVPDLEIATVETRYRGVRRADSRPLRLGRRAHIAVWDTLIATASGEGYQIDLRTDGGRVVLRLLIPVARRPVTPAMREAVIQRELDGLNRGGGERMVDPAESRRLAREAPFADSLPPYSALFVTRDNTLWVVDALAPTDSGWTATAFRSDGAIVGRLSVAVRSRPVAFGNDRVVLRTENALGVVALQVHRLNIPASRSRTSIIAEEERDASQ